MFKKYKKAIALLLIISILVNTTACGGNNVIGNHDELNMNTEPSKTEPSNNDDKDSSDENANVDTNTEEYKEYLEIMNKSLDEDGDGIVTGLEFDTRKLEKCEGCKKAIDSYYSLILEANEIDSINYYEQEYFTKDNLPYENAENDAYKVTVEGEERYYMNYYRQDIMENSEYKDKYCRRIDSRGNTIDDNEKLLVRKSEELYDKMNHNCTSEVVYVQSLPYVYNGYVGTYTGYWKGVGPEGEGYFSGSKPVYTEFSAEKADKFFDSNSFSTREMFKRRFKNIERYVDFTEKEELMMTYDGDWSNGLPEGNGQLTSWDNNTSFDQKVIKQNEYYIGEMKKGKKDGIGQQFFIARPSPYDLTYIFIYNESKHKEDCLLGRNQFEKYRYDNGEFYSKGEVELDENGNQIYWEEITAEQMKRKERNEMILGITAVTIGVVALLGIANRDKIKEIKQNIDAGNKEWADKIVQDTRDGIEYKAKLDEERQAKELQERKELAEANKNKAYELYEKNKNNPNMSDKQKQFYKNISDGYIYYDRYLR